MCHESCKKISQSRSFIAFRALYGSVEVLLEVSSKGFKGTLKYPSRFKIPLWSVERDFIMDQKKVTWLVFDA